MKIAVVGTGYVGLVVGACFAENGSTVVCVDKDESKVQTLNAGRMPIYEPGLEEIVKRNRHEERLSFTTDLPAAVGASEVVFIAVGTPQTEDGSADLQHVLAVARDVGRAMNKYTVVVDKSTVPVGTAAKVRQVIAAETTQPFSVWTFDSSLSTQTTVLPFSAKQAPTTSPTYPVPTTAIFISQ